jgi:hypothetical protein
MNETFDIISLDNHIKQGFANEERKIEEYRQRLSYLEDFINRGDTTERIRAVMREEIQTVKDRLKDIENSCVSGFYILETNEYIEKYKEILTKPLRMSFMGKKETESKEKRELVQRYLAIADKYTDIREYCKQQGLSKLSDEIEKIKIVCKNCANKKSFEIIDGKTFVCDDCGFQEEFLNNLSSFKDVNRVNISSKYTYERRVHFRDCINQYQAKQNSTVTPKVLRDIEEQLRNHGLENSSGRNAEERWSKVTKDHILLFLKETGHTKHYEDVFLIFNKITSKKIDDISYLEPKLLDDFDKLSALYDKKFKQDKDKKVVRKSFINTQYVLYQLLRRHRHPCRKEDFNILKTLDRKSWHDEICKELFEELGWNFFPSF